MLRGDIERVPVSDGEVIAVRQLGHGKPVLLVHGIPGSAEEWTDVVGRLASHHRVIVPDLLGFGSSSRPQDATKLGLAGQAAALTEMLHALELREVAWVGHDYGGPIGLYAIRGNPSLVSHLVLAATNVFADTPIPFPLSSVTWPVVGSALASLVFSGPSLQLMLRQGVGAPAPELHIPTYLGDASQRTAIRTIFTTALRELRAWYSPAQETLADIDIPTAVIWGDRDPFFSVRQGHRTTEAIRGAVFVLLHGAGHFLPAERPADLAKAILDLLASPTEVT